MRTPIPWRWGLAALGLTACSDTSFPRPETVEKDRVLAGRVVVQGDEARTTPTPGEQASYELLVASPGPQVSWTYQLVVCHLVRDSNGAPFCDPSLPPIAQSSSDASGATPPMISPRIEFVVPTADELREDERELLLQGLVCPAGTLDEQTLSAIASHDFSVFTEGRNPCADKSNNGVVLASPFPIERSAQERNHAPMITSVSWSAAMERQPIMLAEPWDSTASAEDTVEDCLGAGFVEVHVKERLGFQLELADGAREDYLDPSPIPGAAPRPRTELPFIQGFASAGKFEILRDNQREPGQILQLEWSMLGKRIKVGPTGVLVRFWFIAGDDRANDTQAASWAERALCVLP